MNDPQPQIRQGFSNISNQTSTLKLTPDFLALDDYDPLVPPHPKNVLLTLFENHQKYLNS